MSQRIWQEALNQALTLAERVAVLGVGSELNGDDAIGGWVARNLPANPQRLSIDAGLAPEAFTGPIRRFQPDLVLVIDAADFGEQPGQIAWVEWQEIEGFSASTHTFPLHILAEYLTTELGCAVALIGIQRLQTEFDTPISAVVLEAGEKIIRAINQSYS